LLGYESAHTNDALRCYRALTSLRDGGVVESAGRLTVRHFGGGHMFYAWEASRREFAEAIASLVADATSA
jgi:GAF domain-containing protein